MARPRKTSSLPTHQTNGALPASKPQSVYEILGMRSTNYKQETFSEYQVYLDTLNLAELQNHAISVANIVPIDDRNRLIDRLEKEYLRINARFAPSANQQVIMSKENKESAEKILRQRV